VEVLQRRGCGFEVFPDVVHLHDSFLLNPRYNSI